VAAAAIDEAAEGGEEFQVRGEFRRGPPGDPRSGRECGRVGEFGAVFAGIEVEVCGVRGDVLGERRFADLAGAAVYRSVPPSRDEFSADDETLAWDADGWDDVGEAR